MNTTARVRRWDVYDIADELADVPGMLDRYVQHGSPDTLAQIYAALTDLEHRLWSAAERAGEVGPFPLYETKV